MEDLTYPFPVSQLEMLFRTINERRWWEIKSRPVKSLFPATMAKQKLVNHRAKCSIKQFQIILSPSCSATPDGMGKINRRISQLVHTLSLLGEFDCLSRFVWKRLNFFQWFPWKSQQVLASLIVLKVEPKNNLIAYLSSSTSEFGRGLEHLSLRNPGDLSALINVIFTVINITASFKSLLTHWTRRKQANYFAKDAVPEF